MWVLVGNRMKRCCHVRIWLVEVWCVCVYGGNRKSLRVWRSRIMVRDGLWKSKSDYCVYARPGRGWRQVGHKVKYGFAQKSEVNCIKKNNVLEKKIID